MPSAECDAQTRISRERVPDAETRTSVAFEIRPEIVRSPGPRLSQVRTRRRMVSASIGFLLTFLLIDFALSYVPVPEVYGSTNRCLWKWHLLDRAGVTPDVTVLGSSHEVHAVNPEVVDATAGRRLHREISTLNLAASASSMLTQYLFARRMVEHGEIPRLVYLGITPQAVDAWMHPWIRNGLRAMGDAREVPLILTCDRALLEDAVPRALFRSYHLWDDVRLTVERLVIGAPVNPHGALVRHATGWAEWTGRDRDDLSAPGDTDSPAPELAARRMADDGINGRSVRAAIAMLRAHGVEVRLLETPVSSRAPAQSDPARNLAYRAFVDRLVAETGVPLVRPPADLLGDGDFWDDVHLGRQGARKLSAWLAGDIALALGREQAGSLAHR